MKISFNLTQFIILTLVELCLLVFLVSVPICSDTAGYLSHPGYTISQNFIDILPYGSLYLFRESGYNNIDWFKSIQFISIFLFNISVLILPCATRVKSFIYLSPFIFSIVGLHYWSCAIRNGLAISFVALFVSFILSLRASKVKINTYQIIGLFFIAALAQLSHWSAFQNIIFCLLLISIDLKFGSTIKYLLALKPKKKVVLLYSIFLVALVGFISFYFPRIIIYSLFESDNGTYNRYLPFVTLASFLTLTFLSGIRKLSNIQLNDIAFISLAAIAMTSSSFFFQGSIIARILTPLLLFTVLILSSKLKTISDFLTLFLFLSPPYIYYTVISYASLYIPWCPAVIDSAVQHRALTWIDQSELVNSIFSPFLDQQSAGIKALRN